MTNAWWQEPIANPNSDLRNLAKQRQESLTKPQGSLGRLEELAIQLTALQGCENPSADRIWISVFAGDHGITNEGVSAFPQSVTQQMMANFVAGGAAISVLAKSLNATLEVVDVGSMAPKPIPGTQWDKTTMGTRNFAHEAAMSEAELQHALEAGRRSVQRARVKKSDIFIGGEMGIGNTTAASAVASALLKLHPRELVGPGTGLNAAAIAHKTTVLERALDLHKARLTPPLESLRRVGGHELAALVGAFLSCAQYGLPALVDGFIASTAALVAIQLQPDAIHWLIFAHNSAEPGHARILKALQAQPLLDLGMRLGEASGAALAVCLLRQACALHNQMATFSEAGVDEHD